MPLRSPSSPWWLALSIGLYACGAAHRTPPAPLASEAADTSTRDANLQGAVWWYDASVEECQEWTFVPQEGFVSLERRFVESTEDWSREVRVFYNITDEYPPQIYAVGHDYTWLRPPGPDAMSLPGEKGAMGCVSDFTVSEATDDAIYWAENGCTRTPKVWHRSRRACRSAPVAPQAEESRAP